MSRFIRSSTAGFSFSSRPREDSWSSGDLFTALHICGMDVRLRPALGSGTTLVDQMRPALRWRYRCLNFPSRQANEGNEFRDRADEKLSVVETSAGAVRTSSPQEPRPKPEFNYPNKSIWAGLGASILSADTAGAGASSGGGWECRSRNSFSFLKSSFNVSSRLS